MLLILRRLGEPHHPFKITLPAPALLGERMWCPVKSREAYPTREAFVDDCGVVLRDALGELAKMGQSGQIHAQVLDYLVYSQYNIIIVFKKCMA